MATIAELLLEKARQESDAQRTQGALANQTWQHLADIVSGTGRQIQQERIEAPIRAQEAQLRGLNIQNMQGQVQERQAAEAHDKAFRDAITGGVPDEDLVKIDPERASKFIAGRDAVVNARQTGYANRQKILHDVTLGLDTVPDDLKPDAYAQKRKELLDNGIIKPEDAPEQFDPKWFQQTLNFARTPEMLANIDKIKAETEKFQADAAKARAEALRGPKPSAEEDKARATQLRAQINLGQQVSREDRAWLKSHEDEQTLGVTKTTEAAAERQSNAAVIQAENQRRAQSFTESEAGRSALTKNVNTPYSNSRDAVESLRDVIRGAEQGNKVDASLISMEAAFAVVRKFGLNRVNTTELGVTGNAGDFMDSIKSRLGKVGKGDPVPQDIKDDMKKLANSLERQAYTKYSRDFDTTAKLYGLSGETKQDDPWEGGTGTVGGKPAVWTTKNGVAGWYPK